MAITKKGMMICPGSTQGCSNRGCGHAGRHKHAAFCESGCFNSGKKTLKCLPAFKPSTKKVILERYVDIKEFRENIGPGVQSFHTTNERGGCFQHRIEMVVLIPEKCPMCGGDGYHDDC